jgi:hypothetical protein
MTDFAPKRRQRVIPYRLFVLDDLCLLVITAILLAILISRR